MRNKTFVLLGLVMIVLTTSFINSNPKSKEVLRKEFLDLKFGMFIHFNMGTYYEIEWVEPGKDPMSFNPTKLDIGQWADAAKSAKMKYAVLTTKHHDGFCLWDSEVTDYDIASTPLAGRDLVKEFCDEFRKRGIEPHFYFSIWDRTLGIEDTITAADKVKIKKQLKELLTNYGKIRSLTFDGWGNCGTIWTLADYNEISSYAKSLQPEILITDHYQMQRALLQKSISIEEAYSINDFLHFEEPRGNWAWAPEGNTFASHQGPTLQSKWFWKKSFPSEKLMSVDEIVEGHLGVLKHRNCNLLLNVAPNPDGLLDQNVIERLKEVGQAYQP